VSSFSARLLVWTAAPDNWLDFDSSHLLINREGWFQMLTAHPPPAQSCLDADL
jgi:hypothetical protein